METMTLVICPLVLAACLPSSNGNIGGNSSQSSLPTQCVDAASTEKENEIAENVDAGGDEEAEDAAADFDDKLILLPLLGNDGKCDIDPTMWLQDCSFDMFQSMRHQILTCRPTSSAIELVRPASENYYPEENVIATVQVKNIRWNGAAQAVEREGDDSVSRIPLFTIVTTETENEDGTTTTEEHCELDNRHIEVRGNYIFEKVVKFVVQTLLVSQPCSP